jgi:hypothetical protein
LSISQAVNSQIEKNACIFEIDPEQLDF